MTALPMRRARVAAVAVLTAAVGVAVLGGAAAAAPPAATTRSFFVTVPEAPGSSTTIRLDAELYTPAVTPAPAVLLAHGFGQTKADLAPEAKRLQGEGYVVLAYTARGFGASGGRIGLDSLDGEVPDARAMVAVLAKDRAVEQRAGDPMVGVVGGSYGGALALMLGATDPRIDTVVAAITWNDLADALAPPSAGTAASAATERDFKVGWASRLFGAGISGATTGCGRFTVAFCDLYRRLVTGGRPTQADLALLANSSPGTVLSGMRAPTLLLQGVQDRLFGLDQADRNERQLAAAGAPVQVGWFDGGHDGGGTAGTDAEVDDWLAAHLRTSSAVSTRFTFAVPASATAFGEDRTAARYPGLAGSGSVGIPLGGGEQTVVNPPGGLPESVTGIPGLGTSTAVGRTATGLLAAGNPPAEAATFASAPLTAPTVLTGAATVRLRVVPQTAGTVVLYAQLAARTGDAVRPLPGGVAPIRVDVPAGGAELTVTLPATVWRFSPGDQVVLTLRTSDSQFVGSTTPASDRIALAGTIRVPTVAVVAASRTAGLPATGVLIGIGAALLVAILLLALAALVGRRAPASPEIPEVTDAPAEAPPLELRGLVKRFRGGFLAVDDVGFTVERGQVLGLLGENGAGKTTTLRMVAGLLRPDAGAISAFGAPLGPGAPVLDRIGCFIEGPGFLTHLTGRRNLELYWAATGRPRSEAHLEQALHVADLGGAIDKRVGGYSQGMRQRLAIAQAMLGLPDLLVLDEPTNGLDPPQITALRGVLQRYAASGRTVVVSSHLLGEVERTCSHVVVMSHGRLVAAGPVASIAGEASELVVGVTDVAAALEAARGVGVASAAPAAAGTIRVAPGAVTTEALVAALVGAGVGVTAVSRGRHLEEAFLELIGATEPSA